MPPQTPNQLDPNVVNLAKALRYVESGGNFTARGQSGEFGAYQFTAPTWNAWSNEVLGRPVPLEQATPEEQNQVAYTKLKQWKDQGFNVGQVASMWNAGEGRPDAYIEGNAGVNDQGVAFDTAAYARKVAEAYQGIKMGSLNAAPYANANLNGEAPAETAALPTYGAFFPYQEGDNGLVAGFKALGNTPSSVYGFGAGIVNMLLNPLETLQGIGNAATGGFQKLTGDEDPTDQASMTFDALMEALKQRYGGLDELTNTAVNDPFGFGTDVAGILGGGAALVGRGSQAANVASKVAQTVTKPVESVVSKATGSAANLLGKTDPAVVAAANRAGVELPVSAYTGNAVVRALDTIGSTGLGSARATARVEAAVDKLDELARSITASTGGIDDLGAAGERIAKGLQEFEAGFRKTTNKLYDEIREEVGDVAAQTSRSVRLIDEIIADKASIGDAANLKYFQDRRAVLTGGKVPDDIEIVPLNAKGKPVKKGAKPAKQNYPPPTFDTLRRLRTKLGEMIDKGFDDPFVRSNTAELKRLYGALSQDIRQTVRMTGDRNLLRAYDRANQAYIAGRREISSQFGRTIRRLAANGQYSKIADSLVKPSTAVEDIPRIMAVVGEEASKDIRSAFISKVFRAARNPEGEFMPQGINRQLKNYGEDKVKAILLPEQMQALEDMGTLTKALGDALKQSQGSQTAFLGRTLVELGALGKGAYDLMTGNLIGGLQLIGGVIGAEAASMFIASKTGQQLLRLAIDNGTTKFAQIGAATTPEEGAPALAAADAAAPPAVAQVLAESPRQYTVETFPRAKGLSEADQAVEAAAIEKYVNNREALVQEYLEKNGNVVNNDLAKRQFADVGYKGTNSRAIQDVAGELSDDAFEYLLKTAPQGQVIFTAGGSGAGKSTVISAALEAIPDVAAIVDGNLSKLASARRRIEQVRAAGKEPGVLYVFRKPSEAWEGVVGRMLNNPDELGRGVPLEVFDENTRGALNVARTLYHEGVPVRLFENKKTGAGEVDISKLDRLKIPKNVAADAAAQTQRKFEKGLINQEQRDSLVGGTVFDAPLRSIVDEINSGGITYNLPGKKSLGGTEAYAVSPFPNRSLVRDVRAEGPLTLKTLARYIQENADLLAKKDFALGGWYDTDSGKIYLDVSIVTPDKARAITIGKKLNQKAAFDLSKFEEIPTGGDGTPVPGMDDSKVLAILEES